MLWKLLPIHNPYGAFKQQRLWEDTGFPPATHKTVYYDNNPNMQLNKKKNSNICLFKKLISVLQGVRWSKMLTFVWTIMTRTRIGINLLVLIIFVFSFCLVFTLIGSEKVICLGYWEEQSKWNTSLHFFPLLTHLEHQTRAKTQMVKLWCAGGSQRMGAACRSR